MENRGSDLPLARLHTLAALADLAGLTCVLLQALFLVSAAAADRHILLLAVAVVPLAFLVFAVMPRRIQFLAETAVPRRSLLVYASFGVPALVTLLSLGLVAASGSFDSFAGFSLLLGADAGRNLWEALGQMLRRRR